MLTIDHFFNGSSYERSLWRALTRKGAVSSEELPLFFINQNKPDKFAGQKDRFPYQGERLSILKREEITERIVPQKYQRDWARVFLYVNYKLAFWKRNGMEITGIHHILRDVCFVYVLGHHLQCILLLWVIFEMFNSVPLAKRPDVSSPWETCLVINYIIKLPSSFSFFFLAPFFPFFLLFLLSSKSFVICLLPINHSPHLGAQNWHRHNAILVDFTY